MRTIIILGIVLLIFIGLIGVVLILIGNQRDIMENTIQQGEDEINLMSACMGLDCPPGTKYVGSINSDKYYECRCGWAKNIAKENLVCFDSDEVAVGEGRVKSVC